jgi:hypothetical protein
MDMSGHLEDLGQGSPVTTEQESGWTPDPVCGHSCREPHASHAVHSPSLYRLHSSQRHIATDGQSVSMSWCRAQSGTFDQSFFFRNCCLVFFGAPSLTRGLVGNVSVFVIEVYHNQSLFTTIYI